MSETSFVYKILTSREWEQFQKDAVFRGSPVDLEDGFIHFSSGDQAKETAEKHFAGQLNLQLLTIDPLLLGDSLRWEPSRGGALFPHLYADLSLDSVVASQSFSVDGSAFPELS